MPVTAVPFIFAETSPCSVQTTLSARNVPAATVMVSKAASPDARVWHVRVIGELLKVTVLKLLRLIVVLPEP